MDPYKLNEQADQNIERAASIYDSSDHAEIGFLEMSKFYLILSISRALLSMAISMARISRKIETGLTIRK